MENPILRALARDDIVTGMILFSGSPMVIEMMAAGVDSVIIDMEHSALDLERCAHLISAAAAAEITPSVRVPEVDPALIKKLLNLGAAGIVVPHANIGNCAAALRAVRYAPEDWSEYAQRADSAVALIPLIEDRATDTRRFRSACCHVRARGIGPTDLSIALGVPGAIFDEPIMSAALDRVVAEARRHGKHVMTTIGDRLDPDMAARWRGVMCGRSCSAPIAICFSMPAAG